jgi:hypothetical protein
MSNCYRIQSKSTGLLRNKVVSLKEVGADLQIRANLRGESAISLYAFSNFGSVSKRYFFPCKFNPACQHLCT